MSVSPGIHPWGWAGTVGADGDQLIAISPYVREPAMVRLSRALHGRSAALVALIAAVAVGVPSSVIAAAAFGGVGILITGVPLSLATAIVAWLGAKELNSDELHIRVKVSDNEELSQALAPNLEGRWSGEMQRRAHMAALKLKTLRIDSV